MVTIAAGGTAVIGNVTFTCPAGGDDCEVEVADDGTATSKGGEATAMLTPLPPPTPVAVNIPADRMVEAGTFTIQPGMTESRDYVQFNCAAGGDPCVVTVDADGMATSTGGTVTTMRLMTMAEMEEMSGRTVGLGDALEAQSSTTISAMVSRAVGEAPTVKITGYKMGDDAPMSIMGWPGKTFTASSGRSVTVYTNIGPQVRKPFFSVHSDAADAADNDGAVELVVTDFNMAGWLDPKNFPMAAAEGVGDVTWNYGPATDAENERPLSFKGTFNGALGTYACTTACDVTVTDAGDGGMYELDTTGTPDWTFTPDQGAKATAWMADADHVHFGWWLQTPAKANAAGDFDYGFRTFYSGENGMIAAHADDLTGTATYTGGAAGMYALRTYTDGELTAGSHGAFTANAELTANFGPPNDDTNPNGDTIRGKISGFKGNGADMSAWEITLGAAPLTVAVATESPDVAATTFDAGVFAAATSAKMGAEKGTGTWTGQFFGQADPDMNQKPIGVAGQFNADFETAHIAGAFGAARPEE
jgi:hypothetical protein